jgi:hypothetical protein
VGQGVLAEAQQAARDALGLAARDEGADALLLRHQAGRGEPLERLPNGHARDAVAAAELPLAREPVAHGPLAGGDRVPQVGLDAGVGRLDAAGHGLASLRRHVGSMMSRQGYPCRAGGGHGRRPGSRRRTPPPPRVHSAQTEPKPNAPTLGAMTPPTQPPSATAARDRRRALQRRRRRRWVATLATVALAGAAGGAWWWFTQRPAGAEVASGPTYLEVTPRTYQVTVPAPGTLRAATTAEVRTVASGAVTWVAALGERVAAGDVVARLDPTDLARDVRDAELALERSERSLTAARADRLDVERSLTSALADAERRLQRAIDAAADAAARLDLTTRLAAIGSASPRELADAQSAAATAREEVANAERPFPPPAATSTPASPRPSATWPTPSPRSSRPASSSNAPRPRWPEPRSPPRSTRS